MSNVSHSFSIDVAAKVGVHAAIVIQHLWFLQGHCGAEDPRLAWVKRSRKSIAVTYPYMTEKEIRGVLDRLEKNEVIESKVENDVAYDRTKSFRLTAKGLEMLDVPTGANPLDERANGGIQKGQSNMTKGPMIIGSYNRVISKLVKEREETRENALPPAVGTDNFPLEAKKEKKEGVAPAAPREFSPAPPVAVTLYEQINGAPTKVATHEPEAATSTAIKPRTAKPAPKPRTVEIPESHKELAPLMNQLLIQKPYLKKSDDALAREMAWLFSKPVKFGAEHIQNSLDRSSGVWDSLKFSGCEETFTRWQRTQPPAPGAAPQQPQRTTNFHSPTQTYWEPSPYRRQK